MKEILMNLYTNILFYKINLLIKICIIYVKNYLTKLNIKYIFKYIIHKNLNIKKIKINVIKSKQNKFYKKYLIFLKN